MQCNGLICEESTAEMLRFAVFAVIFAAVFPYLVLVYAYVLNDKMPLVISTGFQSLFLSTVRFAFRMRPLMVQELAEWPKALHGPSRDKLPAELCGSLFMRGNPAPDAIGDPTWGEWDATTNTLTMPLGSPQVWSWNNDYEVGLLR